jgi:hypothetical protein
MCNCGRRPVAAVAPAIAPRVAPSVRRPVAPAIQQAAPVIRPSVARAVARPVVSTVVRPVVHTVVHTVVPASGIHPSLWGASLWYLLHTAAQFTTNVHQRLNWIRLLEAMKSSLPCPECSAHYNAWITANPVSLPISGPELTTVISTWLLALHNDINRRNEKEAWTVEQLAVYTDKTKVKASLAALRPYFAASFLEHFEHIV